MTKIGYVYHLDANSPGVQSGRPHALATALRSRVSLQEIFPLEPTSLNVRKMIKGWNLVWGRRSLIDRHSALLKKFGKQVEHALQGKKPDLLFGPSTLPFSYVRTDIPITFCSDAPFCAMHNYYTSFTKLSPRQVALSEKLETSVLQRSALCVYPSAWAADAAIKGYGISANAVKVLPFGANFGSENTRPEVERWIEERKLDGEIRLLFVSRDWPRKGGDLVLEIARWLRAKGLPVRLDVVGTEPPMPLPSFAHLHLALRASVPKERETLNGLFQRAHLLLMPSRAEAYGMTLCEANAFGVPVVTTETGGIPEIVRQGQNGVMLPLLAEAPAYGEKILEILSSPATYRAMALAAFQEFTQRLNWKHFCEGYLDLAEQIASPRPAPAGAAIPEISSGKAKEEKPFRVLYVSDNYYDPRDMRSWSGLPQFIWKALEMQGVELSILYIHESDLGRAWRKGIIGFWKLLGKRFIRDRSPGMLAKYARQIQQGIAAQQPDFVFCPSAPPIAALDTKVPICFWVDASFAGMVDYYESFSKLCGISLRTGSRVEQAALSRARLALYSSDWAAQTALQNYTVDPNHVCVVPFGANLTRPPSDAEVEAFIRGRGRQECRLFFAGVDWHRKGASAAVKVVQALREKGIAARLTIIGCNPPAGVAVPEGVEVLGFVDKRDPAGMRQIEHLFGNSHFFILPTKAEAYGLVLCEAAAFGLPALATRSGGIPTIIEDNRTGLLFDAAAPPSEYADRIAAIWHDEKYLEMARAAREGFTQRLNWEAAGRRVIELMYQATNRTAPRKVAAGI